MGRKYGRIRVEANPLRMEALMSRETDPVDEILESTNDRHFGGAARAFFLSNAVGLLYVGWPRLALVAPLVSCVPLIPLVLSAFLPLPSGFIGLAWVTLWLLWQVGVPVAIGFLPARGGLPSQRWSQYLALAFVSAVIPLSGNLFVRARVLEPYRLPSMGMAPTLVVGDYFLARKGVGVGPGDVAVFEHPDQAGITYVKRVVATAGQTVEVASSKLLVDGVSATGDPVAAPIVGDADRDCAPIPLTAWEETLGGRTYIVVATASVPDFGPSVVPPGHVFVMGDFRDNSSDSRTWGPLPVEKIRGRAGEPIRLKETCPSVR